MRFLVTAGNTREKIDRVRDWGNIFTGNTGLRIAKALADFGAVDLLTSNRAHLAEIAGGPEGARIAGSTFTSHAELRGALSALMARQAYDAVLMTAAVADYRPVGSFAVLRRDADAEAGVERWVVRDVAAAKVKSTHDAVAFLGERTEKIVDLFRTEWNHRGLLVKFKLEVGISRDDLVRIGQASRAASGADYLVANTLDMVEGAAAGAYLLGEGSQDWVPRDELAARLCRLVATPR